MAKEKPESQSDDGGIRWGNLSTVKARKQLWLWEPRVPLGSLVILDGDGSTGKSSFAAAVVADITGGPRLDGGASRVLGSAIWLSKEESLSTHIKPRLKAAGADLRRCHFPLAEGSEGAAQSLVFPGHFGELEKGIQHLRAKVVVLDPGNSFLDGSRNLNNEKEVRDVLEPLQAIGERNDCLIVFIRHLRKSRSGPGQHQGLGSVAFTNVARMVLRTDQCDLAKQWRCLSVVKSNLGPTPMAMGFTLVKGKGGIRIEWQGETDFDYEQQAQGRGDAGEEDEKTDAKKTLRNIIGNDWVQAKQCLAAGKQAGIGETRLRKAKAELKVLSRHRKNGDTFIWEWGPPKGGWPAVL